MDIEIPHNEEKFTQEISNLCKYHNMGVIEAITLFCEEQEMDIHDVTSLIGSTMKEKIKIEANSKNLLKVKSKISTSLF